MDGQSQPRRPPTTGPALPRCSHGEVNREARPNVTEIPIGIPGSSRALADVKVGDRTQGMGGLAAGHHLFETTIARAEVQGWLEQRSRGWSSFTAPCRKR